MKATVLTVSALFFMGCSQGSTPAQPASSLSQANSVCIEIATTCHEHEGFSAKAKECHEKGHSKEATAEQCQAMREQCLSECGNAAKQGHEGHAGEQPIPQGATGHDHPPGGDPKHAH
jgi:hypothetical protein